MKFSHYDKYDFFNKVKFEDTPRFQPIEPDVKTSYGDYLELSIMEMLQQHKKITIGDITQKYGEFDSVYKTIDNMILDGKIFSIHDNSFSYREKVIKEVNPDKSFWKSMNAQPCLTCPIMSECGIENPVSPSTCNDFNDWLASEIEMEFNVLE